VKLFLLLVPRGGKTSTSYEIEGKENVRLDGKRKRESSFSNQLKKNLYLWHEVVGRKEPYNFQRGGGAVSFFSKGKSASS